MIPANILHDIQDRLMDSMMDLYNNVEFELVLRGAPVA